MKHIKDILGQKQSTYKAYENNTQRFEQLMQRIDKEEETERSQGGVLTQAGNWLGKCHQWLFGESQPQLRYAALAMTAVIIGQTAYIVSQDSTSTGVITYEAASGDTDAATNEGHYLVVFNADADIADVNDLLEQTDGQIVKGPESGTIYTIRFAGHLPKEKLAAFENNALVEFFDKSE